MPDPDFVTRPKWPELPWDKVVDRISPSVFQLQAGQSAGTAFVVSVAVGNEGACFHTMLATAWHVIEPAAGTNATFRLISSDKKRVHDSDTDEFAFHPLGDAVFDTALVAVKTTAPLIEQSQLLPILPWHSMIARGGDVGWLGFPGIVGSELCFFKGVVSGYLNDPPTYLIDGVAVNGVSGGPAFDDRTHLMGLVSAYIPNQLNSEMTLPGLAAVIPISAIRYYLEHNLGARVL